VAFVIDCFSRAIVGWHAATIKDTAMVTTALKMALWRRDHTDRRFGAGLIHHQRRWVAIYVDCVRGNPCAVGDCGIDRQCWRCLRQRPGGDHDRIVQD
jgi:hypothetical protein